MPILLNERHELMAQGLAAGKGTLEAYRDAGYSVGFNGDISNASRLGNQRHIQARVEEIFRAAGRRVEISASKVIEELGRLAFYNPADFITVREDGSAIVDLSRLDRDQAAAIVQVDSDTVTDKHGTVTVRTKIKLADKRAALELIGKRYGLWVDRHEIGLAGDFTGITSTADLIAKVRAELGDKDAEQLLALVAPASAPASESSDNMTIEHAPQSPLNVP